MGRFAFEWAKRQRTELAGDRVVLLLLADYVEGRHHAASVSQSILAGDANMSVNDFTASFDRLEAAGLVEHKPSNTGLAFSLLIPNGHPQSYKSGSYPRGQGVGPGSETAVYRFYNANGALLYVGVADSPEARFRAHERDKPWWHEVCTREVRWFETRKLALAEEERAIAFEDPIYNAHDSRRVTKDSSSLRPKRRYIVRGGRFARMQQVIIALGQDIEDGAYFGVLPEVKLLAERYGVDELLMDDALQALCRAEVLEEEDPKVYSFLGWP